MAHFFLGLSEQASIDHLLPLTCLNEIIICISSYAFELLMSDDDGALP